MLENTYTHMSLTITAIKAAPYVLTLLKPVLKNLYDLDDGMLKDLIEEGIPILPVPPDKDDMH